MMRVEPDARLNDIAPRAGGGAIVRENTTEAEDGEVSEKMVATGGAKEAVAEASIAAIAKIPSQIRALRVIFYCITDTLSASDDASEAAAAGGVVLSAPELLSIYRYVSHAEIMAALLQLERGSPEWRIIQLNMHPEIVAHSPLREVLTHTVDFWGRGVVAVPEEALKAVHAHFNICAPLPSAPPPEPTTKRGEGASPGTDGDATKSPKPESDPAPE